MPTVSHVHLGLLCGVSQRPTRSDHTVYLCVPAYVYLQAHTHSWDGVKGGRQRLEAVSPSN